MISAPLRGELRLRSERHVGARRRERPEIEAVLTALTEHAGRLGDARSELRAAGLGLEGSLGARCVRLSGPRGDLVVREVSGRRAAFRAHARAHALRAVGVWSPRVLGVAGPARGRGPGWVITEHVSAPDLAALTEAGVLGDPSERRRVLRLAARGLAALHAAGWVHPGIAPERLLVLEDGVCFLGLEALRRARSRRARARDLARLSVLARTEVVGPVERGRFLAAYVGRVAEPRAARAAWAAEWARERARDLAVSEAPV